LLVPDDAEPSALVKCPQCRAFFELQHAESRELPAALIVQSHPEPSGANTELSKSPTQDEFFSRAKSPDDVTSISAHAGDDESAESDVLDFSDEELGAVVSHERSVATTFVLGQHLPQKQLRVETVGRYCSTHIDLSLERADSFNGARSNNNLATLKLFALDTTKKSTHVVTSLTAVQFLVEHLCKKS